MLDILGISVYFVFLIRYNVSIQCLPVPLLASNVDPDLTPQYVASDLVLQSLPVIFFTGFQTGMV